MYYLFVHIDRCLNQISKLLNANKHKKKGSLVKREEKIIKKKYQIMRNKLDQKRFYRPSNYTDHPIKYLKQLSVCKSSDHK